MMASVFIVNYTSSKTICFNLSKVYTGSYKKNEKK